MASRIKEEKNRGALVYLAAFFIMAGAVLTLLPIAGAWTMDDKLVPFSSFSVYFGGPLTIDSYSFYFSPNIPLIIMIQLYVLAFISAMLGKNLPHQLMIGLILLVAGMALEFMSPLFISLTNSSIPLAGLTYAPGFYFSIACEFVALIIMIVKYVESRIYWARKKAVV